MRPAIVLCLIVLCSVHKTQGNLAAFLTNLPSEVGHAFSTAWLSVTDAIKQPVRLKRLGRRGKRKSTRATSAETMITSTTTTEEVLRAETPLPAGKKLELPLLLAPRFSNIDSWRHMQKPQFAVNRLSTEAPQLEGSTTLRTHLADSKFFGPLLFV
ncbi:uncharacterized protein LOC142975019 isoform X2 [Anticarsia gemmatalis]|uniref:uncharacterized protein LOC142975019 isoform X2 n=1 Tax=Anticarsia gemmatalis TaxID=129554 RepID=UPI003F75E551